MKFNWGTGITIGAASFMIFILYMVYLTHTVNVDLVAVNYYEQEIQFQDQIEKMNNTAGLQEQITWKIGTGTLDITFPDEMNLANLEGNINLFRPSDKTHDKLIPIAHKDGSQQINTSAMAPGYYKMKIDCASGDKGYYIEEHIIISR